MAEVLLHIGPHIMERVGELISGSVSSRCTQTVKETH